jgi:hypothetical protein
MFQNSASQWTGARLLISNTHKKITNHLPGYYWKTKPGKPFSSVSGFSSKQALSVISGSFPWFID